MPDIAADAFAIAFGNLKEAYTILDGRSFRILRDPDTTKGQVKFYATAWTGGDVINSEAIKLLKFAAS